MQHHHRFRHGDRAGLTIANKTYHQILHEENDFGEEKLAFFVSEFPSQSRAHFIWRMGSHQYRISQIIDPQRKWTLFLVPHVHLDVGFTDYQAKVTSIQSRIIDEAMALSDKHPGFRFSLDGEWPLEKFLETRNLTERHRVIAAIQKQQLFVPAQYANLLTGYPTAETLIRSLYPSANFSRLHHTPFNYANITDVPSYSWSYASILAAAGIHYFVAGSNNTRAPVLLQGHLNEHSPFWWKGPDGEKVLFWYSRTYLQMQYIFGLPPQLSAGRDALPLFLQAYEHPSYRANSVILFGTQVENTDLFPQQAELAQEWNRIYAYPRIRYSGFLHALKAVTREFGGNIPVVRGDGGPYWEDGVASDAYYAALERQTESRALTAEKLATLTSVVNPQIAVNRVDLDRMWENMLLMDEHTWGAFNSVSDPTSSEAVQQLVVKDAHAVKAHALADFLTRNSMTILADSISSGKNSLIVFNTLNWIRGGLVCLDLSNGEEIFDPSTGQAVPYEVLGRGKYFSHVRFMVHDIPATGYKVFHLRPIVEALTSTATEHTTVLESPCYRVELDPATGAVRRIYDKKLRRELVSQQSPYRFGEYLYVTGSDHAPNTLLDYSLASPKPNLEIHPPEGGRLVSVTHVPWGVVAHIESRAVNTPKISTEIILFSHQKKIEFIEDVTKQEVNSKESVYFAFPFAMTHPQFQYEIQNGVVDPAKDMYPGAGHEWFSVQHWVSVQEHGMSGTVMPLDVPLVTLGDINRGEWPTQFSEREGTILSYAMNNYWFTNYRAGQGGHFRFRFVVTSAPTTDPSALSRQGWQEVTPLEVDQVTSQDKALNVQGPLNRDRESFLNVKDDKLLLETWKPAEDGNGMILRFLDFGGSTRMVSVESPLLRLSQAWQTSAVEVNEKPLKLRGSFGFQFAIHPHEIVTIRAVANNISRSLNP